MASQNIMGIIQIDEHLVYKGPAMLKYFVGSVNIY